MAIIMKCPNCGAEAHGNFCEYCGSEIPKEAPAVNITNNYYGAPPTENRTTDTAVGKCPRCGGSKITFKREMLGVATQSGFRKKARRKNQYVGQAVSQTAYRTVGICQNCGYTWCPNAESEKPKAGRKTWLWVLGWLFIFPLPATILLLRKKDMKPVIKYALIAAVWALFLLIGATGSSETNSDTQDTTATYTVEISSTDAYSDTSTKNKISKKNVSDTKVSATE